MGECVPSGGVCHETCETCSGPNEDDCLTCKNISPNGQLTLNDRKECRCPPGQFYLSATKRCGQCHSECLSCTGTGSDQCLICSDPKSIVKKAQGSNVGSCVSCADVTRKDTTDCKGKVEVIDFLPGSSSTPTSAESLRLENFQIGKKPVRVPNNGISILRLKLPDSILKAIIQLGNRFVFTELMRVSISGL